MAFYLKCKKLDFSTGDKQIVVINDEEAESYGIYPGDRLLLQWSKNKKAAVIADTTASKVRPGEIGLFSEVWRKSNVESGDIVEVNIMSRPLSIETIRKKLLGKPVTYEEIYAVIKDIVDGTLGTVETTYYAASSFVKDYSIDELYYVAKAMAETGEQMELKERMVDKHSVGGLAGNRVTPLVVSIVASLGLYIPKTSSRAITSPAGTADTMEVICPVSFSMAEIKKIVKKTHGCFVWGGGLNLAPADDKIIKVSRPLAFEPYDKMIVSILAKKVAMGVDDLVLDIPVGPSTKVPDMVKANMIEKKFMALGKRFGMKIKAVKTKALEPVGDGIGPALEARDIFRVLQRHKFRPLDLEKKAILLAGELLELNGFAKKGHGKAMAMQQLKSSAAWEKMNEIVVAQGGKANQHSEDFTSGAKRYEIHAKKSGKVTAIDNKAINEICMNLGAPSDKLAGLHLHVHYGAKVKKGDKLFTVYGSSDDRLKLGVLASREVEIFKISKK
ncbi:MAG TPA: AMP phosphorylase [Candidatus Bipolaricaulota bacterium]|nr:AMP phosphorylase [Candidatus Bipolaricaulota bacterium]